ncbi:MAG: hypothetical protein SFZ24_01405 [Planctomycetota bacterium]|nr:hypothetical protein [Planctomycetota bacterium]
MFHSARRAAPRSLAVPSALALTAVLSIPSAAHAGYIGALEMRYLGKGLGENVQVDVSGSIHTFFAGQLRWETRNGSGDGARFNALTLPTFCIEPTQYVGSGWIAHTISEPSAALTPMMNIDRAGALNRAVAAYVIYRDSNTVTAPLAAGFQLALWEIMRDYDALAGRASLSITTGTFKASATGGSPLNAVTAGWTDTFLNAATDPAAEAPLAFAFSSASSQDQIIPAPNTVLLACLGLLLRPRRRRER